MTQKYTKNDKKLESLTVRAFSVKQAHPLRLSLRKGESLPFATLETRGNLGRVNFAKAYGTVAKDRETPLANQTEASLVTIPETIAGHISAPLSFSYLKWRIFYGREKSCERSCLWRCL